MLAAPEALELAASASVGRIVHVLDDRLSVAPINFRLEAKTY